MPPGSRSPPRDTPSTTCMCTLMLAAAARPASSRYPSCALAWSLYPPLPDPIHIRAPAAAPPAPHSHRELLKPSSAAARNAPPRSASSTFHPAAAPGPRNKAAAANAPKLQRQQPRQLQAQPRTAALAPASLYRELACSCTKRADSRPQRLLPDQPAAGSMFSTMVLATSC
jgi:hypothetical protein